MERSRSPTMQVRVKGALACFTRPEMKVERVSYPVMTPSAARGLLESVLWKPAIRWHVESIAVLAPIRFTNFRRNEVNRRAVAPKAATIASGGPVVDYLADEDRAQRNTLALRDVDYLLSAHFRMTDRAGPDDNLAKFQDMFARRLLRGQFFQAPYLGCREFVADVMPPDSPPEPVRETRDLGWMLWDIEHDAPQRRARFFHARLEDGVMAVPDRPDDALAGPGGAP